MYQNQSIKGINSPARLSVSARHYFGSIGSLSALNRFPITGLISALISPDRLGSHKSILTGFLADSRHYFGFPLLSRYTEGQCRIVEGFKAIVGDFVLFPYIVTRLSYCIYPVILYKTPVIPGQKMAFFFTGEKTPPPQKFCTPIFSEEDLLVFRRLKNGFAHCLLHNVAK